MAKKKSIKKKVSSKKNKKRALKKKTSSKKIKKQALKKKTSPKKNIKKEIQKKVDSAFELAGINRDIQTEDPNISDDFDIELENNLNFIEKDLDNDIDETSFKAIDDVEADESKLEPFEEDGYSPDDENEEESEMSFDDPFDNIEDLDNEEDEEGDLF